MGNAMWMRLVLCTVLVAVALGAPADEWVEMGAEVKTRTTSYGEVPDDDNDMPFEQKPDEGKTAWDGKFPDKEAEQKKLTQEANAGNAALNKSSLKMQADGQASVEAEMKERAAEEKKQNRL